MVGILHFVELEEGHEHAENNDLFGANPLELNTGDRDSETVSEMEIGYGDCYGL